jgi:curli production assembly/transport component CsgG
VGVWPRSFWSIQVILLRIAGAVMLMAALSACGSPSYNGSLGIPPRVGRLTAMSATLAAMPAPQRPVTVAVYEFPDLTGQNRPNGTYADYSRAITQGAAAIVVDALKTAGSGRWFTVVERTNVDSLLRERRLIQDTYEVLKRSPSEKIKPLEFAEYLVTGGIISFDAPISASNLSASYKGLGGGIGQNRNLVTINLRLVRVRDGAVVKSIDVSRQIVSGTASASASASAGLDRVFRPLRLVEAEASVTIAEATQIAVREAIEAGVYELVRQGLEIGLWVLPGSEPARKTVTGLRVAEARTEPEPLGLRR